MPASTHALTLPCGRLISRATANAAADWLTLLMSGEAAEQEHQHWMQWRQAHPDHEAAWQHIESIAGRMKSLERTPAYAALSFYGPAGKPASPARRRATRMLLWGGATCGLGVLVSRTGAWQSGTAQYRSGTGERRDVTLEDGTQLTLNTGSAVNLSFDAHSRQILLIDGEIMVTTRHQPGQNDPRPLMVRTAEGSIRSLGTRFTVRQHAGLTSVAVLESAVEITPLQNAGDSRLLHAGERAQFSRQEVQPPRPIGEHTDAWTRGYLNADEQRLADFLAEVGRYRPGILRVAPRVADLRLSGVFPLGDTDRILDTLSHVLPIRVQRRTRFWATVMPAD
ncbi:fecR family protein [Bordetella holmesii 30539]|uniref:Sigma factor regulatory protein, FecR/PupR family n=3 Tax=Bordetella holmesii TaxID=35814 RepID=A0A158M2W4_9BORD|nr:FecR domain-containing protein [Bordetella holmesii]EWM46340.1 fecR family protein [Bordetella holmesii 35009]EXF89388.1 fecR family protein [Bordetella holmesii 30539]EXX95595.1 fecR family protein [Bordetella holmesii 1058]KAK82351.1 sigma factor regulatory protein, FecR/PupR family [Bordetella holmesii CDC-H572-BH]KAK89162.1 sigma factor regulatory protein, FecR/PupR family [Bordetella holmesii CDC-H635-BH]KAK89936.1 sigma factor regulatory protein, FecR/PupR family [Bordetella holmesii